MNSKVKFWRNFFSEFKDILISLFGGVILLVALLFDRKKSYNKIKRKMEGKQ